MLHGLQQRSGGEQKARITERPVAEPSRVDNPGSASGSVTYTFSPCLPDDIYDSARTASGDVPSYPFDMPRKKLLAFRILLRCIAKSFPRMGNGNGVYLERPVSKAVLNVFSKSGTENQPDWEKSPIAQVIEELNEVADKSLSLKSTGPFFQNIDYLMAAFAIRHGISKDVYVTFYTTDLNETMF
jgi:hypothetical protein